MREVIFDTETKKLFSDIEGFNPGDLGVSIVSLYSRSVDENGLEEKGEMVSFWEDEIPGMWKYFQEADRIIGFNSLKFDVPTLIPYATFPFDKLNHFDILENIRAMNGRRISLDALARETLDTQKSDSGLNAVYYWEKGDKESLKKLRKYCEMDVEITKNIYDYGLREKKLLYKDNWNTLRELKVDFSYPSEKDTAEGEQIGLF